MSLMTGPGAMAGTGSSVKHSWTDPATGIVHFSLRASEADAATLLDLVRDRDRYRTAMFNYMLTKHSSTFFHEWAHILQAAEYPYLYLRAARGFRRVPQTYMAIRDHEGPLSLPLAIGETRDAFSSRVIQVTPVRLTVEADSIRMTPTMDPLVRGVITEQDLLEEDATIVEYRIEIGSHGDGRGYARWLAERPHYGRVFSFLRRQMSVNAAFNTLPILVRVAFRSTRPISTFASALGSILSTDPEIVQPGVEEIVEEGLLATFAESMPAATPDSIDMMTLEIDDEPGLISEDQFVRIVERTPHMPLSLFARWSREPSALRIGAILREPWKYFGRRGRSITEELGRYSPPASVVELDHPAFPFTKSIISFSGYVQDEKVIGMEGFTYFETIQAAFRARTVSDALTGLREPQHECPHVQCRVHATGLCRGWVPPRTMEACDFPAFLADLTGRELDEGGRALVQVEGGKHHG